MRFRSLFLIGAGIVIGWSFAKRASQDDPEIVHGPRAESSGNPALRVITGRVQRMTDQATVRSLGAIRGARRAIKSRLADYDDADDAAWN
jgi:hypothetical protein